MRILILFFVAAITVFAQCARTVPNPDTGILDCVGSGTTAGSSGVAIPVPFATSLTFTKGVGNPNVFMVSAMTANITTVAFSGFTAGDVFYVSYLMGGSGGYRITYPAAALSACQPNADVGIRTTQGFWVDSDGLTYHGMGCSNESLNGSIAEGALSQTKTSGASITQYQAVKLDTSGNVIPTVTSDVEFLGIALQSVGNAAPVEVARLGKTKIQTVGTATAQHLAIASTTVAGKVDDSGQTSTSLICSSTKVVGKFLAGGTGNVDIEVYSPGIFGSKICAADLPTPSASTLGGTRSIDCTGTGHILSISTSGIPTCSADSGGSSTPGVGASTDLLVQAASTTYGENMPHLFIATTGSSTAALGQTATNPQNHPGVVVMTFATSASPLISFVPNSFGGGPPIQRPLLWDWDVKAIDNLIFLTNIRYTFGWKSTYTALESNDEIIIRYDSTVDTNWQVILDKASSKTTLDTGVAATTGWHTFEIRHRLSGVGGNETIYFFIDNTQVATFCSSGCTSSAITNLPAVTQNLYLQTQIGYNGTPSAGTTFEADARSIWILNLPTLRN